MPNMFLAGGDVFSWVITIGFWLLLGLGLVFGLFGVLFLRRKLKLKFPLLEIIDVGGGKIGLQSGKCGWFKSKWLFGLLDYGGERVLLTKDKREIQQASTEDLHDLYGKKGYIVLRKGDDVEVLTPLSKFEVSNKTLIMEIAPADYRDTSIRLKNRSSKEMMSQLEKFAPLIAGTVMGILLFVSVMIVIQYAKASQTQAWEFTQEALRNLRNSGGVESLAPLLFPLWRKK